MTRQQIIIAIAVVAGQLLQPYVYKYAIAPPARFIARILGKRLRGWPLLVRFVTKPRLKGLY